MGMPSCSCIPPDEDGGKWIRECDYHKGMRLERDALLLSSQKGNNKVSKSKVSRVAIQKGEVMRSPDEIMQYIAEIEYVFATDNCSELSDSDYAVCTVLRWALDRRCDESLISSKAKICAQEYGYKL